MIFIDKSRINAPKCLTKPNSIGVKEREDFIRFYSDENNHQKTYKDYKAYQHEEIKDAFNKLFHKKCAYCESNYAKVQPVDVEHYRPKGGVVIDGILVKPGYYWLASDWENLLPSCIDCNRHRTHKVDDDDEEFLLGKANLFPIANESARAKKVGYEPYEIRLLLNPCIDSPEEHLTFLEDGIILGKSFMGMVSIETYGLRRKDLTDAREAHAKNINKAISDVKFGLSFMDKLINTPGAEALVNIYEEKLKIDLNALKSFLDEKQEYVALARQMIDPFIEAYRARLRTPINSVS
ncbi:hypothetical protein [Paenibacillus sp. Soil724D2]|uniref:hypothetical protein n=1 Tax=Paenibacillus sp. (strain Soil724D2) TaxID=1736392 RepID=UPI0007129572|nr:hypothetical protein [Paenibacillus sp. Soil724D2]KRE50635.1 hypothetical protein ASG85_20495 [Paenibacillus sp. Soil724D2]